ncbi:MAG: protein kinase [Gammaproteobacteria bacterium]|nr:protein kinase [Gammaproteobacteria bacterium]
MSAILIIDDDADHRRVLKYLLQTMYPGVSLDEHSSALAAEADYLDDIQKYDLVIADNVVAGQDSMGWVRSVLAQYPGKPAFIILSSVTDMNPMIAQQMVIAIKQGVSNFHFKQKLDMERFVSDISGVMDEVVAHERGQGKADEEEDPQVAYEAYKKSLEETSSDVGLALEMVQGHRQWPFTIDGILSGNAIMGGYYRILAYLGEDNTASTFKAREPNSEEPIALKIINRIRMTDQAVPESFDKNFRVIADLNHPNIVRLLNYEVIDNRMMVAMEFLQGGRLDGKLGQNQLEEGLAIRYFRQLLAGMSELHKLGLELHQLIPRQIMFRDEQTLVITQIGLINSLHALSEIAGDWPLPFSTPVYTTPENVQKMPTDFRSDVYLAGLIGYEMMAGKPPFYGGSDQDILYAHAAEPVPALPNGTHPANELLQEMLHKIPDSRPQNATEALKLMDQLVR